MALKTIVFQKITLFNFAILLFLLSICYLVSLITGQIWYYWCPEKLSKMVGVIKSNDFEEVVLPLLASAQVLQKKVN